MYTYKLFIQHPCIKCIGTEGYNIVGLVNSKQLENMLKCLLGEIRDFNY